MAVNPELRAHQEWIGFLQPVGLVVSPAALVAAQAYVNRNISAEQQALQRLVNWPDSDAPAIKDLPAFCTQVLKWEPTDIAGAAGGPPLPKDLEVALTDYEEVILPTHAVPEEGKTAKWLLLIQALPEGTDLDKPGEVEHGGWRAGPQARMERLLRETKVPIGLLSNGTDLRLVYAPVGESSGHVTFPVRAMCEVAGRPILSALYMLLSAERLFTLPPAQRLPAILQASRKYQNDVSTALAGQVHAALNELLGGLQAADNATNRRLLQDVLREAPNEVYGGLLTTLMRLVFVLYAEDRQLLPTEPVYSENYSVTGLFEGLREDDARYHDTMDQRFGAWARLLTLFRLIHDGGGHGALHLPPRYGRLFDPDAYTFLEGRPFRTTRSMAERLDPPRIPDGAIYRALENLLVLDGERLSYRALDVEQIGSVYEAMMGFSLEVAKGPSIALRPDHVVVNVKEVLAQPPEARAPFLKRVAGCEVEGKAVASLKAAKTTEEVVQALGSRISPRSPGLIPADRMYLQPTEERRRSGSHYTPRSLTKPIVETTLRPVLDALGPRPTPEQILDLKVCDPAMGSGAFLVEACRLLADRLVAAWQAQRRMPSIPPDQDPVLYARRLVAQRCLYGVDKNPFAVDLAKLSLWLATLAKEHPFTFLDHALRCGDSLVGLTREQIAHFHWEKQVQIPIIRGLIDRKVKEADALRARLHAMAASDDTLEKRRILREADEAIADVRLVGDLVIAAFFGAEKAKGREALRSLHAHEVEAYFSRCEGRSALLEAAAALREGDRPVPPFHWDIEFPEVFERESPGFNAVVGNPPFLGGKRISTHFGDLYRDWLAQSHAGATGNIDLCAHFFRHAFGILRNGGAFGLLATKTIRQGETRAGALKWICDHGGQIFDAQRRIKWPGEAAVIVSRVHVQRGECTEPRMLDGRSVERITAFLFDEGGNDDPRPLVANSGRSFVGNLVLGMGFTFDDTSNSGVVSSIADMHRLLSKDPRNAEVIRPFIGGEEVNSHPRQEHHRFIIDFGELSLDDAERWPDLMKVVRTKVKPEREGKPGSYGSQWWLFARRSIECRDALRSVTRALVNCQVGPHLSFAFQPVDRVFAHTLNVFPLPQYHSFSVLQSRVHECWARFFSSTMKDDMRYTPSDCFETFPFPRRWAETDALEAVGMAYYEHRASLMMSNNEGLTGTYNRFHDPEETGAGILKLREMHDAMDRAVLDAYEWADISPTCEFLLDYGEDEDAEKPSKRRKPWRYRWPDDTRDKVLARLLALNTERAEKEAAERPKSAGRGGKKKPASKRGKQVDAPGQRLIE